MSDSIFIPFFSKYHTPYLQAALNGTNHNNVKISSKINNKTLLSGLACANNDACYTCIACAGQAINTSSKNFLIPNMCTDCRSIDKPEMVKRAIITSKNTSPNVESLELFMQKNNKLNKFSDETYKSIALGFIFGDLFLQAKIYSKDKDLKKFIKEAQNLSIEILENSSFKRVDAFITEICDQILHASKNAQMQPEIGIIGNAPIVFCQEINGHLFRQIASESCRPHIPYLSTYILYALECMGIHNAFSKELKRLGKLITSSNINKFCTCPNMSNLRKSVENLIPLSLTHGSGWLLPALILQGVNCEINDFVYLSTFACLSGHTTGKGSFNLIRSQIPDINIVSLEFDQGTSIVNQHNRLKLLTSIARQRQ